MTPLNAMFVTWMICIVTFLLGCILLSESESDGYHYKEVVPKWWKQLGFVTLLVLMAITLVLAWFEVRL